MPIVPAPAETDIAHVVRSAQAGDGDAFAELYQRFARMVHGIVLARIARTGALRLRRSGRVQMLP